MNIEKFFQQVGGNYESVATRLPSDAMIKKFVNKFTDDPSYAELENAYEKNDIKAAFMAAHTLKGTAANLGLDALAQSASELTEELRDAATFPNEKYLKATKEAYALTIEKIAELE